MRVKTDETALAQRHPACDVGVGPLVAAVFAAEVADCGDGEAAEDGLWFGGAHFPSGCCLTCLGCLLGVVGAVIVV
jgi:hypothetical protein